MRSLRYYLLPCLILLLTAVSIPGRLMAQIDREFWFAAPDISDFNIAYPSQVLNRPAIVWVSTFGQPATVTISQPANPAFPVLTQTIPANSNHAFDLSPWIDMVETKPASTVLNYGIYIQSTALVNAVYQVMSGGFKPDLAAGLFPDPANPELYVLKGRNGLGTEFVVPFQNRTSNVSDNQYSPEPHSSFDIVATEDNTQVTITPSANAVGHPAGVPFTITLNRGQTYSVRAVSKLASQHMGGSRVRSTRPVAVTMKDDMLIGIRAEFQYDQGGDQIVPVNILRDKFAVVRGYMDKKDPIPGFPGIPQADFLFVTAVYNGTTIRVNGVPVATINAGQTWNYELVAEACFIETSQPVYMLQMSGFQSEIGLASVPGIECSGTTQVTFTRTNLGNLALLIVVESGGEGAFTFNGNATIIPASLFSDVPGSLGKFKYARVMLPKSVIDYDQRGLVRNELSKFFHLAVIASTNVNTDLNGGCEFEYFTNFERLLADPRVSTSALPCGNRLQFFANPLVPDTRVLWTGPNGFTSTEENPFIDNPFTGWYYVSISKQDNSTCTPVVDSFFVNVAGVPATGTLSSQDVVQNCIVTSVNLNLANLRPNSAMQWFRDGSPIPGATGASYAATLSGNYSVQITAPGGCQLTLQQPVTLDNTPVETLVPSGPVNFCQGGNAQLSVTNAAPGTQFQWRRDNVDIPGATGSTHSITTAGSWTVRVINPQGCQFTLGPVTSTVYPLPKGQVTASGPLNVCEGDSVQLTAVHDAGPGAPVQWMLNGLPTQFTGATMWASMAGNWTARVTNSTGCTEIIGPAVVSLYPKPSGALQPLGPLGFCEGDSVRLTAQAQPGVGNTLQYQWLRDGQPISGATTSGITVKQAGDYNVRVTNSAGCFRELGQAIVSVYPLPNGVLNSPPTSLLCEAGSVTLSASGGSNYQWYRENVAIQGARQATYVATQAGNYGVEVFDNRGCARMATGRVNLNIEPRPALSILPPNPCLGNTGTFRTSMQTSQVNGVTYQWTFSNGQSSTLPQPQVQFDRLGPFTATVTATSVQCPQLSGTATVNLQVSVPIPGIQMAPVNVVAGQPTPLEARRFTGARYLWLPATGLSSPIVQRPVATLNQEMTYQIRITSNEGCVTVDTLNVRIFPTVDIMVPKAFSPNGDGKNDRLFPFLIGIGELRMFRIFNRWGQLVFETRQQMPGWDGTFQGKPQPMETYSWIAEGLDLQGNLIRRHGATLLMR